MPALIIDSFPETLHLRLRQVAAAHHRSVAQEATHLIQAALEVEQVPAPTTPAGSGSYWTRRPLLPEYELAVRLGAFRDGTDSTAIISGERDDR
ncbi:FitA-like ribbon-helix-helix domain-containing protein [Brevifollis gellanilyticus]|uniref:Antitoxin FitA-like ribbon-helix-helix domain-containing protein n=1 Tax=Brevifollis gellanilyticus TaxID=748831 RepID=A0A512M9T8_9BACT|nr:hypothetical protein [Brevifollis gellanilyticus]GEP43483.1 hypothetical protein BGE01nite_27740 [Brevifollis gellanilyticus]